MLYSISCRSWIALVVSAIMTGCAASDDGVGRGAAGTAEPAAATVNVTGRTDLLNTVKLRAVPEPVREAFRRQYPNAGITSIQVLDAATGVQIYEINFLIGGGEAQDVLYRPDGTVVVPRPLAARV